MWDSLQAAGTEGSRQELERLLAFAGLDGPEKPSEFTPELHAALLASLFHSNSWIAAVMVTDLFGRSERFNLPGVGTGNWTQRLHLPTSRLAQESLLPFRQLIRASGRYPS
jgi:4-alpha-glucanotransferase